MASIPALGPGSFSKQALDVGFQTNNPAKLLAWYRDRLGIVEAGPPMKLDASMSQHRLAYGDSIIKINAHTNKIPDNVPGGYAELLLARDVDAVLSLRDPDGNNVTLVPKGHLGITSVGLRVVVKSMDKAKKFWVETMGFKELGPGRFGAATTVIIAEEDKTAKPSGDWNSVGWVSLTNQLGTELDLD